MLVLALKSINLILAVLGAVANSLTVFVFLSSKSLRKPANLFLVVLALADILVCSNEAVGSLPAFLGHRVISEGAGCAIQGFVFSASAGLAIDAIASAAGARYLIIVHPALSKTLVVWRWCGVFVAVLCVHAVVGILPAFTSWTEITYYEIYGVCSVDSARSLGYNMYLFMLNIFPPYVLLIYMYWSIFRVYRQSKRRVAAHAGSNTKKHEFRMSLQIFIILVLFTISMGLTSIVVLLSHHVSHLAFYAAQQAIFTFNSAINPVIYFHFNRYFRQEFGRLFLPCVRVRPPHDGEGGSRSRSTVSTGAGTGNQLQVPTVVNTQN